MRPLKLPLARIQTREYRMRRGNIFQVGDIVRLVDTENFKNNGFAEILGLPALTGQIFVVLKTLGETVRINIPGYNDIGLKFWRFELVSRAAANESEQ